MLSMTKPTECLLSGEGKQEAGVASRYRRPTRSIPDPVLFPKSWEAARDAIMKGMGRIRRDIIAGRIPCP